MKKILAISALILAAHCSALSQGQLLAYSGQGPVANDPVSTKPLKTVLLEIEKHYHVYIVADNGLLEEKRAESIDKTLTVEQALKSALNDTELTFRRIKDNFYVIMPVREDENGREKENTGSRSPIGRETLIHASTNVETDSQLQAFDASIEQQAMQESISGKVVDSHGQGLPGVNIVVKGTTQGTTTDSEGNYVITMPEANGILVFSFIGFQPQEIALNGRQRIDVTLLEDTRMLDEVVVMGYGTVRRSDITGAVSTVKFDEKEAAQLTSVDKLLQGRSPGVYVNAGSAAPGGAVNVRIRGASSFSGGSEPLYVVDGIIINTATQDVDNSLVAGTNPGNSSQEAQNGLTAINPQDIASIEVLKDASATAIYGSRAANGVILITTKQGSAGKGKVTFSTNTEVARVSRKLPMLDGVEFARFRNETEALLGRPPVYNLNRIEPVDWQDDIYGSGVTTNNRLSISGSNDKTNYYLAAGFLKNDGVIPTTGLNQTDLRFNLTQNVSNRFKVSTRTGLIYRVNSMTQSTEQMGSASNSIIRQILAKAPIYDTLGPNLAELDQDIEGPRAWLKDYDDISKEFRAIQSLTLDYMLSDAFTISVMGGADIRFKDRHRWFGTTLGQGRNTNGQLGYSSLKNYTYNTQALLYYKKSFGKHRINGTIGGTYDQSLIENAWTVNEDFWTEDLRINGLGVGARITPFTEESTSSSILSALARVVYSYDDKYVLTVTGRADGTSRFAPGNKWGYFPSMALAWHAGDEQFIKNLNLFSTLKPRIGFGMTGNQAISPYATLTRYSPAYYATPSESVVVGAAPSLIANRDLKWESSSQLNIGVDFGFMEDRLTFTVDVYDKKTKDLLQQLSIPTSAGFSNMWVNNGEIENKGLEISANGQIVDRAFSWSMGGNISFNRNKIVALGKPEGQFGNLNLVAFLGKDVAGGSEFKMPANIFAEGYPMAVFFGYETKGIYQEADVTSNPLTLSGVPLQPGDIYFVDQNGDGNINDADKVIIGDPNPKFTYGLNSTMGYKRFTLTLFMNGVYGNDIANGNKLKIEDTQSGLNVTQDAYRKAWNPEQPGNTYPRLLYKNGDFTDRILEDGSFFRLGIVTLGYKPDVKNVKWLNGLDVFVTCRNLLTITNYSGYDPEVNSFTHDPLRTGVDWSSYPNIRSYGFGANITF